MDSTLRFSNRVENYVRYRPAYPKEIIHFLETAIRFNTNKQVADIGSGTGISAQLFLEYGNTVFAVEPNDAMRKKAEELLKKYPYFISIPGTAEATNLRSGSINLIIAGQAFHWFDQQKAKIEFYRIASADAYAALVWNDRQVKSAFEKNYEQLLLQYGTDYKKINHRNISKEQIGTFFRPQTFIEKTFYNEQVFNFESLKGRLLSSSYVPDEHHRDYKNMLDDLQQLYKKYAEGDKVKFEYQTIVYVGKIK